MDSSEAADAQNPDDDASHSQQQQQQQQSSTIPMPFSLRRFWHFFPFFIDEDFQGFD